MPELQAPLRNWSDYDQVGNIIAYEQGELCVEDVIKLFQCLVDTGVCNQLQGHYGRTASDLIEKGFVSGSKYVEPTNTL